MRKMDGDRLLCDGCRALLVEGAALVKPHRLPGPDAVRAFEVDGLAFCGGPCMLRLVREDRGMHLARVVVLVQEAERLRVLEVLKCAIPRDDAASWTAIVDGVVRHLVTRPVGAEGT